MKRLAAHAVYAIVLALLSAVAVYVSLRLIGAPNSPPIAPAAFEAPRDLLGHVSAYLGFVADFVTGDWGASRVSGFPVTELLVVHGRNTLVLGLAALAIVFIVGVPLGVLAGFRRRSPTDAVVRTGAVLGLGFPHFWLGLLLVWLFGPTLGWLPAAGCCSLRHLILPAFVLSLEGVALTVRLTRATVIEALDREYVTTLRALGLDRPMVLARHVLRNVAGPLVSVLGLRLGAIVGGAVIVERVFSWPGLGFVLVDSVVKRDFPVAQAFALVLVLAVVAANLAADWIHPWVDPRLRRRSSYS